MILASAHAFANPQTKLDIHWCHELGLHLDYPFLPL